MAFTIGQMEEYIEATGIMDLCMGLAFIPHRTRTKKSTDFGKWASECAGSIKKLLSKLTTEISNTSLNFQMLNLNSISNKELTLLDLLVLMQISHT